jgi:hypothetical protein
MVPSPETRRRKCGGEQFPSLLVFVIVPHGEQRMSPKLFIQGALIKSEV